ncbi:putative phosphoesterase [Labilithrix luteola]|uniref:Putative phosphoesterase n=1 Tax=Labilithrix luteola TaxID=1391654 RepID=A0A0K1Q0J5_9BACT|nr:metallophosphoesterase [Labilithrix luteola]AKU99252.1 putative phosphoesterase [Labilithrix luteola]
MWALMLLGIALSAHAVLIAWLRRLVGGSRTTTLALAAGALVLTLALFAPREYFGYTSFELFVVAVGASLYVGLVVAITLFGKLRSRVRSKPALDTPKDDAKEPAQGEAKEGRRETLIKLAGAASWATSIGVVGWGAVRGRHDFELTEVPVRIEGLPRALDGYVIVQVSDLHGGTFVGEADLNRGFELVRQARPDLLVATGDLVDFDPGFAPMIASRLADVAARDGAFAVLGNHDHYADAPAVLDALARARITALVDDARILRAGDGGGFALLGTNDLSAPRFGGRAPDLGRALAAAHPDRPRILLAHQPRQFDEAAGKIALQLSGHTHGMQFDFAASAFRIARRYVAGRYDKDGSVLWVNRGFGVTGPPSRVGVRPEITKIVLVSA